MNTKIVLAFFAVAFVVSTAMAEPFFFRTPEQRANRIEAVNNFRKENRPNAVVAIAIADARVAAIRERNGITTSTTAAPTTTEKTTTEKPTEKPTDKPADEPADAAADKPAEAPADDKPADGAAEEPADAAAEEPAEPPAE